jgi:cephalosporin hydroxylase
MGVPTQKCPLDLWIYQELVFETRPQLIVETGTLRGGSALYLAHLCDLAGEGEVVTVDVAAPPDPPRHQRVTYVTASSTDERVVADLAARAEGKRTMVVLDSDHGKAHVLRELELLAPLVSPGCYLVVEDTCLSGHPIDAEYPGPMEALEEFLGLTDDFEVDREREKFFLTFNPSGYLRRRLPA